MIRDCVVCAFPWLSKEIVFKLKVFSGVLGTPLMKWASVKRVWSKTAWLHCNGFIHGLPPHLNSFYPFPIILNVWSILSNFIIHFCQYFQERHFSKLYNDWQSCIWFTMYMIQAEGRKRLVVWGHSMGGAIACQVNNIAVGFLWKYYRIQNFKQYC